MPSLFQWLPCWLNRELVDSATARPSKRIVLLAVDFYEDLINEKDIAITNMFALQSSSVYSSELDAPKANRFSAYSDASLCEKVFNVAMT
jgi:hypothetical protein